MGMKKRMLSGVAAGIAAVGLLAGGASAASALSYTPTPAVDGSPITVTSTGSLPAGGYRVGVCTVQTFGSGPTAAPACGALTNVTHGGGVLVATTGTVFETGNANAHSVPALPAQPADFDCDAPGSCEVVIVNHSTRATVESATLAF
ncbi:hypothetical protein [Leucobacter massiliensis]|nr:hypothetical protein [Leucobacter massiliensis]